MKIPPLIRSMAYDQKYCLDLPNERIVSRENLLVSYVPRYLPAGLDASVEIRPNTVLAAIEGQLCEVQHPLYAAALKYNEIARRMCSLDDGGILLCGKCHRNAATGAVMFEPFVERRLIGETVTSTVQFGRGVFSADVPGGDLDFKISISTNANLHRALHSVTKLHLDALNEGGGSHGHAEIEGMIWFPSDAGASIFVSRPTTWTRDMALILDANYGGDTYGCWGDSTMGLLAK